MMVVLALWLGLTAQAAPFCEGDLLDSLERTVGEVHVQYASIDETGFDRAAKQLEAAVACLDAEPPGATLARLHQANSLIAFVNGQKGAARRAMIAARLADPTWKPDSVVFPEGHPYRQLWQQATDAGPVREIGEAPGKQWIVDGVRREEAPTERAFLLQVAGPEGIQFSEYLYDYEDIPDFGQDNSEAAWATPHRIQVSLLGAGRVLDAEQVALSAGLRNRSEGATGGGVIGALRLTPLAFVGLEAEVASLGGADALLGDTFAVEWQAVALFGAGTPVSEELKLYGNARVGYARDTVIAWTTTATGVQQTVWPVNAFVVGAEGGVRADAFDLRALFDGLLASGTGPYEWRVAADGTYGLVGPLAARVTIGGRSGSLALTAQDGSTVGDRRDVELRFAAGVSLWFE